MKSKNSLKKLQKLLKEQECDALLIEDLTDILYLTGIDLSLGTLLVHQKGALLLVDGRYIETCKRVCPFPVKLSTEHPLPYHLPKEVKTLAFDKQKTSYGRFLKLVQLFKKKARLRALDAPLQPIRLIKDANELSLLEKAAKLGSEGYDYICSILEEGMTELEVALELEIFWKKRGGSGFAFEPIIAFGKNGSMPHYKSGNVPLKKGDPVLLDIGVTCQHYHSDMTRVVFFGKPSATMKKIYTIVWEAQETALKLCKPGTKIKDLDIAARSYIEKKGYGDKFSHSLGHGIGLEVHETPGINSRSCGQLQPGMVITIEPGIYLPNSGGVRIEDTVAITKSGHQNFTNRSKDLLIL